MTLVRWKPQHNLMRDLNCSTDRTFHDVWARPSYGRSFDRAWMPSVNIQESENEYEVTMDLPGLEKDDIKVSVRENLMSIEGERKQERAEDESDYHLVERRYGTFKRSFRLSRAVDAQKIRAKYNNGVLTLSIPKSEEAKPREIDIAVK
jgi:HSP20 family protein